MQIPRTGKRMSGTEVSRIRANLGLTQSQFAAKLEVYPSHVSKWERGDNQISKKNENKVWELYQSWTVLGPDGDQVIAGYDPDGSVVDQDEEVERINEVDRLETAIMEVDTRLGAQFPHFEDDDVTLKEGLVADLEKARVKVTQIIKERFPATTELKESIQKTSSDFLQMANAFGMTEVRKTAEVSYTQAVANLKTELDSLSNEDFDLDRIWDTFGLNPKTLTDEQKIEFFDKVLGEAIDKVNAVVTKTLEGPQGLAFKQKLREGLDRKSKEIQESFRANTQTLIRKSTDRENEMAKEIEHLKEKTKLLIQASEAQVKLNERTDSLLSRTEETLVQFQDHLKASQEEKKQMQDKIQKLGEALKKTAEWVDEQNKYTDEQMEEMKKELKDEIEEAQSYMGY